MSHDSGHPPLLGGGEPRAPDLGPRAHWANGSEGARGSGAGEAPGFWDKKANVDLLFRVLYAVSALLVILDLAVDRYSEHPWEHVWEFYTLYGFLGIVLLVLLAKGLRRLVMRPEDYYGAD
jgi:hypothetical protein